MTIELMQNLTNQFDLIFGKASPLLATTRAEPWLGCQASSWDEEDELDEEEEWDEEDEWNEGDYDEDWEEDCDDDWLEDDYDSDEDEGTEYRNSSDCLFKAIEKANDSLDD